MLDCKSGGLRPSKVRILPCPVFATRRLRLGKPSHLCNSIFQFNRSDRCEDCHVVAVLWRRRITLTLKKNLTLLFSIGLFVGVFPWIFSHQGNLFGRPLSIRALGDVLGISVGVSVGVGVSVNPHADRTRIR